MAAVTTILDVHLEVLGHHVLEDACLPRVHIAEVLRSEPLFLLAVGK